MVQLVKPSCNVGDPGSIPGLGRYTGEGIGYPFHCPSASLMVQCMSQNLSRIHLNAGDAGSIPGLGRSPGEGKVCPSQYSGPENSTDCLVYGVAESGMTERPSLTHSQYIAHSIPAVVNGPVYRNKRAGINILYEGGLSFQFKCSKSKDEKGESPYR